MCVIPCHVTCPLSLSLQPEIVSFRTDPDRMTADNILSQGQCDKLLELAKVWYIYQEIVSVHILGLFNRQCAYAARVLALCVVGQSVCQSVCLSCSLQPATSGICSIVIQVCVYSTVLVCRVLGEEFCIVMQALLHLSQAILCTLTPLTLCKDLEQLRVH